MLNLIMPNRPEMKPMVGGQLLSQSVSSSLGLCLAILYTQTQATVSDTILTLCQPLEMLMKIEKKINH